MFRHIGKKVKVLAIIFFVLMIVSMTVLPLTLIRFGSTVGGAEVFLIMLVYVPLAFVIAWISSWPLYALGQSADKAEGTEEQIRLLRQEVEALRRELSSGSAKPEPRKSSAAPGTRASKPSS